MPADSWDQTPERLGPRARGVRPQVVVRKLLLGTTDTPRTGCNSDVMRVHIATDHAAFDVKEYLVAELTALGYDVVDHGAHAYDALDHYPVFCIPCAEAVVAEPGSLGIVLGGSGNGEQIAANKVKGVRAGLAYNPELARLTRNHNDANVLAIGGRMNTLEESLAIAKMFLETPFSGDDRHATRIQMLTDYEDEHKR